MPYDIRLLSAAERDLKALARELDKGQRRRLTDALAELHIDPLAGDVTPLVGTSALLRRRVDDYRIVFSLRNKVLLVVVVLIGDRKKAYDILDRRDLKVLGLSDAQLLAVLTPVSRRPAARLGQRRLERGTDLAWATIRD